MKRSSTPSDTMDTSCQAIIPLLPAYSMGTATAEEVRLVEAQLPFCPEAQAALADYRLIGDALLTVVPTNEAPPPVEMLLSRIQAQQVHQIRQTYVSTSPVAAVPMHQRGQGVPSAVNPSAINGTRTQRSTSQSVSRASADRSPAHSTAHLAEPARFSSGQPLMSPRAAVWIGVAAALIVLAFVGTNLFWYSQIDLLRRDQQLLLQVWADQQTRPQPVLNGTVHHRVLLAAEQEAQDAQASFVWNSGDQVGALVVDGLPALNEGETYQLWLVSDQESLSLGTFSPDDAGVGVVIFQAEQPITDFDHIGVSVEPTGGTEMPTSPHLIIGNI